MFSSGMLLAKRKDEQEMRKSQRINNEESEYMLILAKERDGLILSVIGIKSHS